MIKKLIAKYSTLSLSTKSSIAYTFANLISKSINIITIPVFTRIMSTSEIGITTTYTSWYTILYAIVTLSLCSGSMNIAMLDYKERRFQYQSSCLTLSSLSGVICLILYSIFSEKIIGITGLNNLVMWVLLISLIVNPALDFWYAKQRYEYKYKSSVFVSIFISVISAISSLFCVIYSKNIGCNNIGDVKIISQGAITLIVGLFLYIYIMSHGKVFIDFDIWKYALSLSIPLIVHTLAKSLLDVSDRIMISQICGQSEAGIYGTVYSISLLALLVWNAINTSIIPITFEYLNKKEYNKINQMLYIVLILFAITSILVALFAPEILLILTTSEYSEAVYLIPALCAGIFFTALYNIYGNFLLYKKKTTNIMIATLIATITNIALNYIFLKRFGYIIAAYTTLVSFIVLALFQCIMVRLVYKEKNVNNKVFWLISFIVVLACLLCNILYKFLVMRYIVITCLFILLVINKEKLFVVFKKRGKEDDIDE